MGGIKTGINALIDDVNKKSALTCPHISFVERKKTIDEHYLTKVERILKITPTRAELIKENSQLKDKYDAIKLLLDPEKLAEFEYVQKREKEDKEKL